jgi:F0F1-type ATP synthase assembly protein I
MSPRQLGQYYALAQVGMEMVTPLVAGVLLDYYLESSPWGSVVGAVLGFVGGLVHLIALVNSKKHKDSSHPPSG